MLSPDAAICGSFELSVSLLMFCGVVKENATACALCAGIDENKITLRIITAIFC